jgi:hypothetical protein
VRVAEDIRTGFNFDHYQAVQTLAREKDVSAESKRFIRRTMRRELGPLTTNKVLRGYWALMLDKAKAYGIGRIELVPIRTNAEACGKYVGGYMTKSCFEKQPGGRRTRFVTYSANFKKACTSQFASNGPRGQEWRRKRAAWAAGHGLREGEEKEFLGPRWAWHYREQILATDVSAHSHSSVEGDGMDLHVDGHRGRFEFQMEDKRTGEQEGNPPSQPSVPGFVFRVHGNNYQSQIEDSETPLSTRSFVSKTVLIPVEQPEFAQANSMGTISPEAARAESQVPNGINGGDPAGSPVQQRIKALHAIRIDQKLRKSLGRRPFMPDRCLSRSGPLA